MIKLFKCGRISIINYKYLSKIKYIIYVYYIYNKFIKILNINQKLNI